MQFIRAFGRVVRNAREDKKFSQQQLAEATGLHFTAISRMERGELRARLDSLELLAAGLGLKISDLVLRAEKMQTTDSTQPREPDKKSRRRPESKSAES